MFRDGEEKIINSMDLVPGDIVYVGTGDNIPADIIVIQSNEMKVNNSSLTGESEEMIRVPEEKSVNIFESKNVAFFGTSCTNGYGYGLVFKIGDSTVMG